jgi:hypothetical protein
MALNARKRTYREGGRIKRASKRYKGKEKAEKYYEKSN